MEIDRRKPSHWAGPNVPKVGSVRCGDAVSFGVEVAADLHRVARLTLVIVVVGGRLDEERVFALSNSFDSLVVRLDERGRACRLHERPHPLIHRYRRLLHASNTYARSHCVNQRWTWVGLTL